METQTKQSQKPSMEQILEWVSAGIAEATDGYKVEPDGECPHGCPSWLLELEMI